MLRYKNRKFFIICSFILATFIIFFLLYLKTVSYSGRVTRNQFYIDKSPRPTEEQLIQELKYKYPNIPFDFWKKIENNDRINKNDSCAPYPDIWQLELENIYWQKFLNKNISITLYSAYYDCRPFEVTPVVRILGMSRTTSYFPPTYCQMWFNDRNEPVIVPASFRVLWSWDLDMDEKYAHMLSCVLPKYLKDVIPQTVSLVGNDCEKAHNNLKVIYNPLKPNETQQDFAICLKFLNFPYVDRSPHLVEWFELMKLLGVTKIGVYKYMSHENIEKVLQYYNNTGFVEYTPLSPGSGYAVDSGLAFLHYEHNLLDQMMNEVIPFNDCFYKNMYKFKYIAVVDSDEVIMPQHQLKTWHDMIEKLDSMKTKACKDYVSYCVRNGYFPIFPNEERYSEEVPDYFHMLQHVKRVENLLDEGSGSKCIHNTKYALTLHNHWPFEFKNSCGPTTVNESIGILNHYRQPEHGATLNDSTIIDTSLWRYKNELVENSERVLQICFKDHRSFINNNHVLIHFVFILLIISVLLASWS